MSFAIEFSTELHDLQSQFELSNTIEDNKISKKNKNKKKIIKNLEENLEENKKDNDNINYGLVISKSHEMLEDLM